MNVDENNSICYFDQLPDEIKVKLLTYLDTSSLINFCAAYPAFEYLSHDKDTIHCVNFSKQYKYDAVFLQRFLGQTPRCEHITVLNINSVYWIPSGQLRKCIVKLKSLECLYAVDTKLGVTPEECLQYSSLKKIKKIGLSLVGKDFVVESVMNFPDVVGLYLHAYACTIGTITYIKYMINRMKKLREIWIIDCDYNNAQLSDVIRHIPSSINSATFVLYSYLNICRKLPLFAVTFQSNEHAMQLTFEKSEDSVDIYNNWKTEHTIWDGLLNELHSNPPFGPKDAQKLVLKQQNLQNIQFEELNFSHLEAFCCIRFQNLVYKALMLPNCVHLKKLSISFCICDETWRRDRNLQPQKKKQKSDDDDVEAANLRNIVRNCPLIEELEIWGCEQAWSNSIHSLKYIQNLPKLKALSLIEVPLHVDGSFLIDVCKSCLELRSLKVTPLRLNAKININLVEALKYAKNLKDFRFEHMLLPMQQIIEQLTTNNKLKRLFLKCTSSSEDFSKSLPPLCFNNPQLVFIMIIVKEWPKMKLNPLQSTLHKHKHNATQQFYCVQHENTYTGRLPIPQVHRREIIEQNSAVGVIDVFNGFV